MNNELLLDRLMQRKDMQEIPIIYLIRVLVAVLDEMPELLEETENE